MKKIKVIAVLITALAMSLLVLRCQHDDEVAIPIKGPDPIVHGTEKIPCTDCNTVPAGSGIWYHDKSHSNVMWETQYKTLGSLLTGRFDSFFMTSLNFDEAVPANITFEGYVRLNTVNTSEPARDDGCLLTSFGTDGTKVDEAVNKAILKSINGTGRYSTSDAGFLVDAEFTMLGITKTVTVKFLYAPKYDIGTAYAAGFASEFTIKKADYLPNDTNIGDVILIRINSLMRIKK